MNNTKKRKWYYCLPSIVLFAALFALLYLCAILQSCSMYKQTGINGKATIVTTDTTYINHNTLFKYQKK